MLSHPTGFIEPCLPTPSRTMPDGSRWAFEVKHDGFRFICRRKGDRVRVFSRNARDWSDRVPLIVNAMRAVPVTSATIDGEGVMVDDHGVTDFERLLAALAERDGSRFARYFAPKRQSTKTRVSHTPMLSQRSLSAIRAKRRCMS